MKIYIDKFKCNNCGKPVVIKSSFVDGSIYDYLCPKCWNETFKKKKTKE